MDDATSPSRPSTPTATRRRGGVIEVLREHELPGVPVVNEGGRCVGIITEEDLILRARTPTCTCPTTSSCSAASSSSSR